MTLTERINDDLKAAMKSRDEAKVSTLRMLKAAVSNAAIQKGKAGLEDGEILEVIQRSLKQHQESVEAFTKGGRADLVQKESREAEILKGYLPAALSEAELKALIQEAVRETGAGGPQGMGAVMKAVMPKIKGRADGKRVSDLVKQILGAG
ncbi:MAG: GatB/YqeY domain-containing protein [Candidatus Omnitrophica bacterium]|nr:GatB/YqeY domain-containing protein [Candidatus Omnitrophota bacterium]